MTRPRVFIVEPYDRVDVSEAEEYGDIVYLFPTRNSRSSIWDEGFVHDVLERLQTLRYNSEEDYFVIVGPMVTVTIAVAALAGAYSDIQLLAFNTVDRCYQSCHIGVTHETNRKASL